MRVDAVFARGRRRAPKWMALFGAAFALGTGSASAQVTIGIGDPTTVAEGGSVEIPVTVRVNIPGGMAATTISVTATASAATPPATTTDGASRLPTAAEGGDYFLGPASVSFDLPAATTTPLQRTVTDTIRLAANNDPEAEDDAVELLFGVVDNGIQAADGGPLASSLEGRNTRVIVIQDTDPQVFEWTELSTDSQEGSSATVNLRTTPDPVDLRWQTNLIVDGRGYSISPSDATLEANRLSQGLTITAPDQDGNRTDDTVMVHANLAGTNTALPGLEPLSIEFADINRLPDGDRITWRAYRDNNGRRSSTTATVAVEGGAPVHVTVTVDRGDTGYPLGEALVVRPTAADPNQNRDFRADPASVEISSGRGRQSATFKLYALVDEDVGDEKLVLNLVATGKDPANGSGEVMAEEPFEIALGDETTPLITPKLDAQVRATVNAAIADAAGDDGQLNPGEGFSLMTRDLFVSPDPVALSATSSDPAVAEAAAGGDTVTVTARSAGTATITITGTVDSSSVVTQTAANVATVAFDVTVDEHPLAFRLSGPDDRTLVEGGPAATVTATVTTNRPVTADTTIELFAPRGTANTASLDDYRVEPIVIRAGETTGTTLLTAVEDNRAEPAETLTLQGRAGDVRSNNTLTFTIYDAAVPALPVIAQLLLAAFLAVGGYRRYLRRR